jgi:hypothetical protein
MGFISNNKKFNKKQRKKFEQTVPGKTSFRNFKKEEKGKVGVAQVGLLNRRDWEENKHLYYEAERELEMIKAKKEPKKKHFKHFPKKKFKRNKTRTVMIGHGKPCEGCGKPTMLKKHAEITQKQLDQAFYYKQWRVCVNRKCKKTAIMDDEDRVLSPRYVDYEELKRQQDFIKSINMEE